jgi:hypothetical protein
VDPSRKNGNGLDRQEETTESTTITGFEAVSNVYFPDTVPGS